MNKIWNLILLLFIIILGNVSVFSQNFERFSNKEGFNQNTTHTIEQDRYGFLWYGTPNGLIKYDGYEFETYTTQSETDGKLISNYISSLLNDDKGILWIGTNLGLNVYIPWLERFHTLLLPSQFRISHISVGPMGRVWFSGDNKLYVCELIDVEKGIFKISDNIINNFPEVSTINTFVFKDENTIVLGTTTGLKQLSLKNEKPILSNIEETSIKYVTTVEYINNIFWIGTNQGLYKATLDENRLHIIQTFDNLKNQIPPTKISTIFEDHSGMVWIGTKDNGLYKYNQELDTFEHFKFSKKNELGISSNFISALYQDDFNVLWIGTAQGGINKLDLTQKPFITYSSKPHDNYSIQDDLLTSILEDSRGKLWLSGYHSPLFRSVNKVNKGNISKLKFEDLEAKLPFPDSNIMRGIYEDDNGYIWLGSNKSVIVYSPFADKFKKVSFQNKNGAFELNHVREFLQIDKNHMLLAGNQIVIVENPWQQIKKNNTPLLTIKSIVDLQNNLVQTLLKNNENSFWIGTNKGLLYGVYEQSKLTIKQNYTSNENQNIKLSNNNIFSLHREKNHLWIGTFGGGLNKVTLNKDELPTKIEYFRKNDILPDDVIYGILQEGNSFLWLSTDMGLVKFNIDNNKINVFDVRDGLPQNNFRQKCYFKGKSGYFYFGGLNGLTIFKPENIN